MRIAAALFEEITAFKAVTSLRGAIAGGATPDELAPPMHPRCAERIGDRRGAMPCQAEWRAHLGGGPAPAAVQSHTCPLGLRCSCIPIRFGGTLVGLAKFVADPDTPDARFAAAARVLELAVSGVCQDLRAKALEDEVEALQSRLERLRSVRQAPTREKALPRGGSSLPGPGGGAHHTGTLVGRALEHIADHYLEPDLSLEGISRALAVNGRYLTHLFSQTVGTHMHAHIVQLRVQHACRMLIETSKPTKQIANESGFARVDVFRRTFRESVGVSPGVYRSVFAKS